MARRFVSRVLDLSGGLRSGVSEYGLRPRHLTVAKNVEFRPYRACQTRRGTKRACSATLAKVPHSLMEWVSSTGTAKKYVGCADTAGILYLMSSSAYTAQTTPAALQADSWLSWDQLHGALWVTEQGGSAAPFFYRSTNAANTFLTGTLPAPDSTALTLTAATDGAVTGLTLTATYYYRLRHLFADGSSLTSGTKSKALAGTENKITVSTIPVNPSGRTDYTGWVLERTTALGGSTGPFYLLSSGTATSYVDTVSDPDLGYEADEVLHGSFPGGHAVGLIAMNDRLAGWTGSTLYLSQGIGDRQDTGIANWDARNGYDFGPDDGDSITAVIKQGDRYLVLKQNSVWALEGNTLDNFRVVHLYQGAGASGARAACSMGQTAWFFGAAGLHIISGNSIRPFGYIEIGDVLKTFDKARLANVVLKNHLGQRLYIAFSTSGATNAALLVYDQRFQTWSQWSNIRANDILIQKVTDFGDSEAFLYADTQDRATSDYRPMIGFYGELDDVAVNGTGGTNIAGTMRTPWIDDGTPDAIKSLDLISVFAEGSGQSVGVMIESDLLQQNAYVTITLPDATTNWGDNDWGDGTLWGWGSSDIGASLGLPQGLFASRYRITFTVNTGTPFVLKGYSVEGVLQPERRYS